MTSAQLATRAARNKLRLIAKETERVIRNDFRAGAVSIKMAGLTAQVALGTGLTVDEVRVMVQAYVDARPDLYMARGRYAGLRRKS